MLDSNRPTTPAQMAETIWDEETGETYAEAMARFATFGPVLTAAQVADLPATSTVWAFGYGDDPVDFDTIETADVLESIEHDGLEATDTAWGPFVLA